MVAGFQMACFNKNLSKIIIVTYQIDGVQTAYYNLQISFIVALIIINCGFEFQQYISIIYHSLYNNKVSTT